MASGWTGLDCWLGCVLEGLGLSAMEEETTERRDRNKKEKGTEEEERSEREVEETYEDTLRCLLPYSPY